MTQVEEIKAQLLELTEKVNQLSDSESSETKYSFTEEQMIDFIVRLNDELVDNIRDNIKNASFDVDEIVELDFDSYSKTIEVDIDERQLSDLICDEISGIDSSEIITTVDNIYESIKA